MENFSYNRIASALLRALGFAGLVVVVGCNRYVQTPAPVDQGSYLVHVVAANGETVRTLTRWYTGSERAVREVANLNAVREGSYLKPGQRILIPSEHVRKTTPPPKQQFSKKAQPRSRKGTDAADVEEVQSAADSSVANGMPDAVAASPSVVPEGAVVESVAAQPNQESNQGGANATLPGQTGQVSGSAEPATSPAAKPSVVPQELTLEDLLKRERSEVDRLKEELNAGQPVSAEGAR
jgi:hypothetical protein